MYRFEMFQMKALSPSHTRYGILCKQWQNAVWIPAAVAAPFSDNPDDVVSLAKTCTRLQFSPSHLIDAVSDFISQSALST